MPSKVCLDYIMHNDDTQGFRTPQRLVHTPRRDPVYNTRRDRMMPHCCSYSRDRNRRT